MNGMEMMLKSMGIDPAKIMADFTSLSEGVKKELSGIRTHLENIEKQNIEILTRVKAVEERGEKAWQKAQELEAQMQQSPQPTALAPLNH